MDVTVVEITDGTALDMMTDIVVVVVVVTPVTVSNATHTKH